MFKKICSKCYVDRPITEFYKDKSKPDGYRPDCKSCTNLRNNKYYNKNTDKILKQKKIYKKLNKHKIRETNKIYFQNNRLSSYKYRNKWRNNEYHNNINYNILQRLRSRTYQAIKQNSKSRSTQDLLGCSIEHLKNHLESQFSEEMNWDNYGKWHIDHIRPCASFDLSKRQEQLKCFHYTNLQPLWAKDNQFKSNYYG